MRDGTMYPIEIMYVHVIIATFYLEFIQENGKLYNWPIILSYHEKKSDLLLQILIDTIRNSIS